jgi:uncharacterized protein (DUF1697 family)
MFNASDYDARELEQRIAQMFGTAAFVRSRMELKRIVSRNPYRDRAGAGVLLLGRPVSPQRRRMLKELEFEAEPPVVEGRSVFFLNPTLVRGYRTLFDFERALEVTGTMRAARVLRRVEETMSE